MVVCYTLLSHSCQLLAAQVELLRRHVCGLSRIIVIQGPFGKQPLTSGGNVRLSLAEAETLGVDIIELPDDGLGRFWASRLPHILGQVFQVVARQAEEHALVLHGDVFPLRSINVSDLLAGRSAALRGSPQRIASTWFALTRDYAQAMQGDFAAITTNALRWPARDITQVNVLEQCGFVLPGYEDRWRFEKCEPGWLHLDQMSMATQWIAAKLAIVRAPLQITTTEVHGEVLDNLPVHYVPFLGHRDDTQTTATASLAEPQPSPFFAPHAAQDQRLSICTACPNLQHDNDRRWCGEYDDNHSDQWNCSQSKHHRFTARLFRIIPLCPKWTK